MKTFFVKTLSIIFFMSFPFLGLTQNGDKTLILELETGQSSFSPSVLMNYMESIELRLHYFGFDPVQVKVFDRKDKILLKSTMSLILH